MSRRTVRDRGLVLRAVAYSDSSQIVTLFTRGEGVVSLLAKGSMRLARRSSSFPAPFDLAGWYDIVYRRRGGQLELAMESRLVEGFTHLRHDVDRYLEACLALELLCKCFVPGAAHPRFLRSALSYLKLLGVGRGRRQLRVHLQQQLLAEQGWEPQWRRCSGCEETIEGAAPAVRVPDGSVCDGCASGSEWRPRPGVVAYLAGERRVSWGNVPGLAPGGELLDDACELLEKLLLYHLERPPRSLRYLLERRSAVGRR